jgi:hypothetical protein
VFRKQFFLFPGQFYAVKHHAVSGVQKETPEITFIRRKDLKKLKATSQIICIRREVFKHLSETHEITFKRRKDLNSLKEPPCFYSELKT